ncbi:MAG TPA: adenylate/guanylate cyclase domain-containing protein [Vineibacter sp.]|nr:adenylate/guanylate cyclase domain-containing protein [Vineibacter sp.]
MLRSAIRRADLPIHAGIDDKLSRFVPPLLARQAAVDPAAFDVPRQARVTVLFADIVGFTRLCEDLTPTATIDLLGEFHRRMARVIAAHGAGIDDYIGDGVMAVWGGMWAAPDDTVRALRCAMAMLGEMARWNHESNARQAQPVRIGIGLHVGEAMIGNSGDDRRAKLMVLGDAVNVASRLERATRQLGASLVVSDDVMRAACRQAPVNIGLDICQRSPMSLTVRGRRRPVDVWVMHQGPDAQTVVALRRTDAA